VDLLRSLYTHNTYVCWHPYLHNYCTAASTLEPHSLLLGTHKLPGSWSLLIAEVWQLAGV
jgi:hypothetical protein